MKKIISELQKELDELKEKRTKIENAIKALQNICEHKLEDGSSAFELEGNDSHKDYYKCSICGYETYR